MFDCALPSKGHYKSKENGWRGITKNQHNHATNKNNKKLNNSGRKGSKWQKPSANGLGKFLHNCNMGPMRKHWTRWGNALHSSKYFAGWFN
jgi:hypothetical protein